MIYAKILVIGYNIALFIIQEQLGYALLPLTLIFLAAPKGAFK